ncbi:MAG: hypothetical protein M1820_000732 [Bogoriella megaspora]|nr:MAG: hypothetical protein M1820_000732 [Bogoriella megaspora]
MDELYPLHATHGDAIFTIVGPTFQAFIPSLLSQSSTIQSIPSTTHSYGSHPRQKLDLYPSSTSPSTSPILVFFYGGGLIRGDKILPVVPEGLVYRNLGVFFAKRGINTVVADYRRVNDEKEGTGEDARFPSGGEDVAGVLKWVNDEYLAGDEGGQGRREVVLMGNSAGGVHVATFLFEERFHTARVRYGLGGDAKVGVKGVVLLAVPFHYGKAEAMRKDILDLYYGEGEAERKSVCALLEAFRGKSNPPEELGIPELLVMWSEYDPQGEIVAPGEDFVKQWNEIFGTGLTVEKIDGHNHISPPLGLSTGDTRAEKWGEHAAGWVKK